jgi:hypothetical protein
MLIKKIISDVLDVIVFQLIDIYFLNPTININGLV